MTYFLRQNDTFWPRSDAGMNVKHSLPAGNYIVRQDEFKRLHLVDATPFQLPDRVYGSLPRQRDRIINTFRERPATTGVLLSGEKGSGKTLLAKSICASLFDQGVPTILINQPFCGDDFNLFIQTIDQPAVIMFDEFEKIYKRDEQAELLTLLDGVITTKKLFILTCNDPYRVDQCMQNRPGRLYYFISFRGLSKEFIREYCEDTLAQKDHIDRICAISDLFAEFNFDMLKAVVEEMNRYGDSPEEALQLLNVRPETAEGGQYNVCLILGGQQISGSLLEDPVYFGNPFGRSGISTEFKDPDDNDKWHQIVFTDADFVKYDPAQEMFVFKQGEAVMTLTKVSRKNVNYLAF